MIPQPFLYSSLPFLLVAQDAVILYSSILFQHKSIIIQNFRVRVDDYMRSIKNHLQEAVSACIKAAGHEFEPKTQRSLMKVSLLRHRAVRFLQPIFVIGISNLIAKMIRISIT